MTSNASETPIPADVLHDVLQTAADDFFDTPITADEVEGARKQIRVEGIRKAFSSTFFNVCPIPHSHDGDRPADHLVSEMHCKDFDAMSRNTKILLYRACLQLCHVSSKEFPYPFMGDNPLADDGTLCPFTRHARGVIRDLTKNWSSADRARLRHQIKKHVSIAAGMAFFVGMALGSILTPSGNKTIIMPPYHRSQQGTGYHSEAYDAGLLPLQPRAAPAAQPSPGIVHGNPETTLQAPSDGGSAG